MALLTTNGSNVGENVEEHVWAEQSGVCGGE